MKKLYLYRLFLYSKTGFVFAIIFLIFYSIVFFKKMDMAFFPYNNMFSVPRKDGDTLTTYGVKVNNALINITPKLYWKKDLLETSLNTYAKYLDHDQKVFMNFYVGSRSYDEGIKESMLQRLTPPRSDPGNWLLWYSEFAGYPAKSIDAMEIIKYRLQNRNRNIIVTDSAVVYSNKL